MRDKNYLTASNADDKQRISLTDSNVVCVYVDNIEAELLDSSGSVAKFLAQY